MNRKEIITADLCARLPHGAKVKTQRGSIFKLGFYSNNQYITTIGTAIESDMKPILFPSITAPITAAGYNDGLPFVPYDEIVSKIHFDYAEETIEMLNNMRLKWDVLPFWVIDLLNQWHVNYRLLPGEYIEATNEYA